MKNKYYCSKYYCGKCKHIGESTGRYAHGEKICKLYAEILKVDGDGVEKCVPCVCKTLEAENAALRSAVQYLIDCGGADCCSKCIYCPQPTEEDDDCDCLHKGECVGGMIKWFAQKEEEKC